MHPSSVHTRTSRALTALDAPTHLKINHRYTRESKRRPQSDSERDRDLLGFSVLLVAAHATDFVGRWNRIKRLAVWLTRRLAALVSSAEHKLPTIARHSAGAVAALGARCAV